jgi:hypothetical protein
LIALLVQKKALAFLCMGFLFAFTLGCQKKQSLTNTYPFTFYKQPPPPNGGTDQMPNRQYAIWGKGTDGAPGHLLDDYLSLFEKYGFSGNGYSLDEHIQVVIRLRDPDLLNHLEFDSNSNEFLVWADSEHTVQRFMDAVLPVFGNAASMETYLKQADPGAFME